MFRNQAKKVDEKKQFINDYVRSDFHRKFMNRYVMRWSNCWYCILWFIKSKHDRANKHQPSSLNCVIGDIITHYRLFTHFWLLYFYAIGLDLLDDVAVISDQLTNHLQGGFWWQTFPSLFLNCCFYLLLALYYLLSYQFWVFYQFLL